MKHYQDHNPNDERTSRWKKRDRRSKQGVAASDSDVNSITQCLAHTDLSAETNPVADPVSDCEATPDTHHNVSWRDLLCEAFDGVGGRPVRLVITLIGTVLGIASLVATIGFAQTASGQISQQFDALAATRITVEPNSNKQSGGESRATTQLPWDSVSRTESLAGVKHTALYAPVASGTRVEAVKVDDPSVSVQNMPPVVAGSPGLLAVSEARLQTGRFFDEGNELRADRVAILGSTAAERLGINRISGQPAVFIGGHAYAVIGIFDEVGARSNLLESVVVPVSTARADLGLQSVKSLDIQFEVGASSVVSRQVPIALDPNAPKTFKVAAPSSTGGLQENVESDVNVLFLVIGFVALLGGGIGIANVSLLSVAERRAEIGLRRALGARIRDIARQFMIEALTTGLLGGIIGVAVGLFALVGVCLMQHWTPVVTPMAAPLGVFLGAAVGLLAGGYPAFKAAHIEPVDALRGV